MKKSLYLTLFAIVFGGTTLFAQEEKPTPTVAQQEMMALAKASQNPVADMNTIPVQFNWISGGGLGKETLSQTLIQPVLPLPLTENWNIVSRTIVPVMNIPAAGGERLHGIGDIQEQIYFSPSKPKSLIWAVGPVLSLPTATIEEISTGQFAIGPSVVLLAMPGKFVLGGVANQMWRFSGNDTTTAINSLFVQPFINYNFKLGWSISTAPSITANWAAASDQQWTVPVGMGVSKITMIGGQPLNISLQYYHNAVRPDNAGADQVRMVVAFLFPRKG
ncbi:hypothetical protein [Flavobacterium sp. N3904]|uniref:hypothetical protein n=1 Tax=Flavobacterium sp. N3904 TaxID=2986835 RepID=UPI0022246D47|nr:hypothetical protein [Flavobacterium sp. N3904]